MISARCRNCDAALVTSFCDLGLSPLANSYVDPSCASRGDLFLPLHAFVCDACLLVQLSQSESPEAIFSDYAYFSSFSQSWLDHARRYCDEVISLLHLDSTSYVVEIASNDGYLLQNFVTRGIPVLGIEPAANVAAVAQERGIPTAVKFFGRTTADWLVSQGSRADLVIGNNVLAHVPDLADFVDGLRRVLKPDGVVTLEFPHLLRLMESNQFDTIYHEHFSYFSLLAVRRILAAHGLRLFDVQELSTHGGSLRIFATHQGSGAHPVGRTVQAVIDEEQRRGLDRVAGYTEFADQVRKTKRKLLRFVVDVRDAGQTVVGYGAPAKGNTLLNYCGIGADLVSYTVDRSPHKQGKLLPGSRLRILNPDTVRETQPDYILILPWNLEAEICEQMSFVREWGGRFVVPIPEVRVVS